MIFDISEFLSNWPKVTHKIAVYFLESGILIMFYRNGNYYIVHNVKKQNIVVAGNKVHIIFIKENISSGIVIVFHSKLCLLN
jgi:hypothetical protein